MEYKLYYITQKIMGYILHFGLYTIFSWLWVVFHLGCIEYTVFPTLKYLYC